MIIFMIFEVDQNDNRPLYVNDVPTSNFRNLMHCDHLSIENKLLTFSKVYDHISDRRSIFMIEDDIMPRSALLSSVKIPDVSLDTHITILIIMITKQTGQNDQVAQLICPKIEHNIS